MENPSILSMIAITTCVGETYAKVLDFATDINVKYLKHLYIVTDSETKPLIKNSTHDNVTIVEHNFIAGVEIFEAWERRHNSGASIGHPPPKDKWPRHVQNLKNNSFNKGSGLRIGQKLANEHYPEEPHLIMDSDIVLTEDIYRWVQNNDIITDVLYTIQERRDYLKYDDYTRQQDYITSTYSGKGFGYFQLVKQPVETYIYYDDWKNGSKIDCWFRDDILHKRSNDWKDNKITIPYHLDHLGQDGVGRYKYGRYDNNFF